MSQAAFTFDDAPPASEPKPQRVSPISEGDRLHGDLAHATKEHAEALRSPKPGFETAILSLYRGIAEYAEAHSKEYGSIIAQDYVIGEAREQLGQGFIGLLNGELGRFDGGTFDGQIRLLIEQGGTSEATRRVRESLSPKPPTPAPQPARSRSKKPDPTEIKIGQRALTDRQRELLSHLKVENNIAVYQPDGFIDDWAELKAIMTALGGSWKTGGKKAKGGFRFDDDADAQELVRLALETGEILDARSAEFFATSDELADELAAFIDPQPGDVILEPSAGKGSLIKAIRRRCPKAEIVCVEPFPENAKALREIGLEPIERDFLGLTRGDLGELDHAILNSPFSGRADVKHITHALSLLPIGGRLAAIASAGTKYRDDKIGREFRHLIETNHGRIIDNPDGSFNHAGTGVRTVSIFATRTR
jgi:hypothetical protein